MKQIINKIHNCKNQEILSLIPDKFISIFLEDPPYNITNCDWDNKECNPVHRIHPTQKPLELIKYLVKTYSNENDIVFDGFSGSGTTAVACKKLNRKFIGCEINKDFYKKSVNRLNNTKIFIKFF